MSASRRRSSRPHSRNRIALICDSLEDTFQSALVNDGLEAAVAHDVDLLIVPGGKLGDTRGKTFIHDLVGQQWVDGIILAAHTIGHVASEKEMGAFLERLRPVPTVCLGEVAGADCCLVVENETAVHHLTQHLVQQHHHERFVFVTGPETNLEARAREDGFSRALEEARLPISYQHRVVGDFTWEGGRRAICELLDRRGVDIDAVDAFVCANDAMAAGACIELERRNLCVPWDVAVVGFDDTELACHLPAPLTTARQPIRDLLFDATRMLVEGLAAGTVPRGHHRYGAEPIVRRSCGCPRLPNLRPPSVPWRPERQVADAVAAMIPAIREDLDTAFAVSLDEVSPQWLREVVEALLTQLEEQGTALFDILELLSFSLLRAGKPTTGWQQVLLVVRRYVAHVCLSSARMLPELDRIVDGAIRLTSELGTSFVVRQREELVEHLRVLSDATARLLAAPELGTTAELTRDAFPKLGVHRGLVSLFSPELGPGAMSSAAWAFGMGTREEIAPFPAATLGPDKLLRGRNWVVEPLGVGDRPLGLAVLESGLAQPSWYERLRDALSAAIKGADLIREVQYLVVMDPLTGVNNRRYLTDKLRQELVVDAGAARPLSLLVLDLDGFKSVNDERGHDEGDRALVEAAAVFKQCLRESDTLARFGGDEFVAILPGTNADNARAVAQRVLRRLPRRLLQKTTAKLTCSIGIATSDAGTKGTQDELFRLADQALLEAKRRGKNRAVHASELGG
jgi:sigma-B regulation protein RsbU (phosphoserine phosphatase)